VSKKKQKNFDFMLEPGIEPGHCLAQKPGEKIFYAGSRDWSPALPHTQARLIEVFGPRGAAPSFFKKNGLLFST
jgi:hypothetical protein